MTTTSPTPHAVAHHVRQVDQAHDYAIARTLSDRIGVLIGDSVPHWRTLKPVTSGTDYWDRHQRALEALNLAQAMNAAGIEQLGGGCPVQAVEAAFAFLQFQRAHYMDAMEALSGPEFRQRCEQDLERLREDTTA
jgi:hypothetical protein